MKYVNLDAQIGDISGVLDPVPYLEQLPALASALPVGARAFATASGHYDFSGKRCVKDLTLQRIRGVGGADGELEITFRHNCWKHDEDLVIHYTGVSSLVTDPPGVDHTLDIGSLVLDEVLPHEIGCSHEIAFWEGTITVVCRDLVATWTAQSDCPVAP
ncbi:hypothetical protein [Streptomyces albipurpureus]|uniref:Uncharacterized protein n=1 Tax=Streptomyces albipurpureus TaxID=2897419 RepID=A0ABT0UKS4_9ACTN|nr:hypothetical protein [Streptomyces sp. CWNU-1]MCM2388700.1 hypothetical protein [Streptomyces sp. CWNU-1]